ncbi:hypothetical protein AC1031_021648 [Aphanomyces cochlioides]|nr:hypothetical protein AC1031_021648 [Aphanomyces cochlioides]
MSLLTSATMMMVKSSSGRRLGDIGDDLVSIFILTFSFIGVPLSIFVAVRGLAFPRVSAFTSVVMTGIGIAFLGPGAEFVIGMSSILILTIVICLVKDSPVFLLGANAALCIAYTIFTMTLPQVVNTPSGYVPASSVNTTLPIEFQEPGTFAIVVLVVCFLGFAIAVGVASLKLGRLLIAVSSSIVGIWFSVYLVGAYFSRPIVDSSYDYFKIFALKPWITWPTAVVLSALATLLQLRTIREVPEVQKI